MDTVTTISREEHKRAIARRANAKLRAKSQSVELRLPIGQRDAIKAHAAAMGETLTDFLRRAAYETMEADERPASERD